MHDSEPFENISIITIVLNNPPVFTWKVPKIPKIVSWINGTLDKSKYYLFGICLIYRCVLNSHKNSTVSQEMVYNFR